VLDLAVPFSHTRDGAPVLVEIKGGPLGHWSVWTRSAMAPLDEVRAAVASGQIATTLLARDSRITDSNGAFFDVANNFRDCIAGCHEVLRRQGLLEGTRCLDPAEGSVRDRRKKSTGSVELIPNSTTTLSFACTAGSHHPRIMSLLTSAIDLLGCDDTMKFRFCVAISPVISPWTSSYR
jgi:hypothetical protein